MTNKIAQELIYHLDNYLNASEGSKQKHIQKMMNWRKTYPEHADELMSHVVEYEKTRELTAPEKLLVSLFGR